MCSAASFGRSGGERGGAIEVFADASDAKARADYIQVPHQGDVRARRVRLRPRHRPRSRSHYLTPDQAAEYKAAVDTLK